MTKQFIGFNCEKRYPISKSIYRPFERTSFDMSPVYKNLNLVDRGHIKGSPFKWTVYRF